jgi:hypothetical protein
MSVGFTFLFTICIPQITGEPTPEYRRGRHGRLKTLDHGPLLPLLHRTQVYAIHRAGRAARERTGIGLVTVQRWAKHEIRAGRQGSIVAAYDDILKPKRVKIFPGCTVRGQDRISESVLLNTEVFALPLPDHVSLAYPKKSPYRASCLSG